MKSDDIWEYLKGFFHFTSKGMINLTTSYMKEFNQKYNDAAGIRYYSYSGVTGPNEEDYLPPVLYIPWAVIFINEDETGGGRNDSMVSVNSAQWGEYKGEIPADHFKQVGYDLSGWSWFRKIFPCLRPYNHLRLFENIVNDLRSLESELNER